MRLSKYLCVTLLAAGSALGASRAGGVTIIGNYLGGDPQPVAVGGGNLPDIFAAAASIWETAIRDTFTITFDYGWAPNGGGEHWLLAQGGTPNRETHGMLLFNNDSIEGHHWYYLDPTPSTNEEYESYAAEYKDYGYGPVNMSRYYSRATGDAAVLPYEDLLTVVLHEMGHGLGMSLANTSFIGESADGYIDLTPPLAFTGYRIPLQSSHIDNWQTGWGPLMASGSFGTRQLPSELDILAESQVSQWRYPSVGIATAVTAAESSSLGPRVGAVSPNPTRSEAAVVIQGDGRMGEARVFDTRGGLVRRLTIPASSGQTRIVWDGRDRQGNQVVAGVYFIDFRVGATRSTRKVTVLR